VPYRGFCGGGGSKTQACDEKLAFMPASLNYFKLPRGWLFCWRVSSLSFAALAKPSLGQKVGDAVEKCLDLFLSMIMARGIFNMI